MRLTWKLPPTSTSFDPAVKYPKYFIAIKRNEGDVLNHLSTYIPLLPPQGKFYADPMLFKYRGVNYLFFEDYDYRKGVISYVEIDREGQISSPRKALELPIHLSFPQLFQEGNEIYMTPETHDYGAVFLFKAIEFPDRWEPERFLIRGEYFSDPILFKHNGYYWLFAAVHQDHLVIYYANDLRAEFLPHPINSQAIRGRNAGPVYSDRGRLVRPTMDCSQSYGRSMILKEIVLLDPSHFVERDIAYIQPTWAPDLDGTHTYCQNEDYVVYDGQRNIFPREDLIYSLIAKRAGG
jgi:hypothetical protein